MIEPIYVVVIQDELGGTTYDCTKHDIKIANEIADALSRSNPGDEVHVCRTVRVIKAAKPELQPIQELTVGP